MQKLPVQGKSYLVLHLVLKSA